MILQCTRFNAFMEIMTNFDWHINVSKLHWRHFTKSFNSQENVPLSGVFCWFVLLQGIYPNNNSLVHFRVAIALMTCDSVTAKAQPGWKQVLWALTDWTSNTIPDLQKKNNSAICLHNLDSGLSQSDSTSLGAPPLPKSPWSHLTSPHHPWLAHFAVQLAAWENQLCSP